MATNNETPVEEERRMQQSDTFHLVGMIDLDNFKSIYDTLGYVYGDEVLLLLANLMEKAFRSNNLVFRYGGEEFVVVLTHATEIDSSKVYERFRQKVESFNFPQVGQVTASIGIVTIHAEEHRTTDLDHADKVLYFAKQHGRNQVCNYHELLKQGNLETKQIKSDIDIF